MRPIRAMGFFASIRFNTANNNNNNNNNIYIYIYISSSSVQWISKERSTLIL